MNEGPLPLSLGERFEEQDPPHVEGGEEEQGDIDFGGGGVGEFGPEFFGVGFNEGGVFGESEAEAEVGVEVAVGDVVDGLTNGPATGAVGRFELGGGEAFDGGAEELRGGGEGVEELAAVGRGDGFGPGELADGVAGVFCRGHSGRLSMWLATWRKKGRRMASASSGSWATVKALCMRTSQRSRAAGVTAKGAWRMRRAGWPRCSM